MNEVQARISELIDRLGDRNWNARRTAVAALAEMGPTAAPHLIAVLTGSRTDEAVLAAAVDALATSKGDIDRLLLELLEASQTPAICDAAQVLGRRRSVAAVATLGGLTRHADDNVAVAAIEALGRIADRGAVEALMAALGSRNFFREFPALDALARIADVSSIAAIAHKLETPHLMPEAARALGRFGEPAALAPLTRLLHHPGDAMVRLAALAIYELQEIYEQRYGANGGLDHQLALLAASGLARRLVQSLAGASELERAAIARLLGHADGPEVIEALSGLVAGGSKTVAPEAAKALRRLGRSAEDRLVDALRTADEAGRLALLPLVNRSSHIEGVLRCLDDADPKVRAAACDALGRIGSPSAISSLFTALKDNSLGVVQSAVGAIQALGGPQAEKLAREAAADPSPNVRRAALGILAYFAPPFALDTFAAATRDEHPRVRDAALQGLAALDDAQATGLIIAACSHTDPGVRASAARALAQVADQAAVGAVLLRALDDDDAWVRYYALQSLGKRRGAFAAPSVVALLSDRAGHVRVAAVEALSMMDSPLADDALADSLRSSDPDIQRAALIGIGLRAKAESLPRLSAAARDADPATRLIALSALRHIDHDEVLRLLVRATADPDLSVRTTAVEFLSQRPGGKATAALIRLLGDPELGASAAAGLAAPVDGRVEAMFAGLASAGEDDARAITAAFARARRPEATHALFQALALENIAARKAAAITLSAVGTKESLAAVKHSALEDSDPEVRRLCALLAP